MLPFLEFIQESIDETCLQVKITLVDGFGTILTLLFSAGKIFARSDSFLPTRRWSPIIAHQRLIALLSVRAEHSQQGLLEWQRSSSWVCVSSLGFSVQLPTFGPPPTSSSYSSH